MNWHMLDQIEQISCQTVIGIQFDLWLQCCTGTLCCLLKIQTAASLNTELTVFF